MSESVTMTFSVLKPDGGEELLGSCSCDEDTQALLDWLCYTKQLNSTDRTIIVRHGPTATVLYKLSACGSVTAA